MKHLPDCKNYAQLNYTRINYAQINYAQLIKTNAPKIIILLEHGLGNKLSTLACGLFFAKKHGIKDVIIIYTQSIHEVEECYNLSLFTNAPLHIMQPHDINILLNKKDPNKIIINTTSSAHKYNHKNPAKIIVWTDFYAIFDYLKNDNYTKKFFQKLYHKIYKYNPKVTIKNDTNNYSIGVHVRLGDFLKQNISNNDIYKFLILRPSYYIDRINNITDSFIKIHGNKTTLRVYFFSDNTNNFIEKHILPYISISNVIIPKEISAIDSLVALSRCDFLVLSESTFSTTAMLLKRTIGLEYYPSWRIKKEVAHKYAMTSDDLAIYF